MLSFLFGYLFGSDECLLVGLIWLLTIEAGFCLVDWCLVCLRLFSLLGVTVFGFLFDFALSLLWFCYFDGLTGLACSFGLCLLCVTLLVGFLWCVCMFGVLL